MGSEHAQRLGEQNREKRLSVSLEAIAENALACLANDNKLDLAEIGNRLINLAIFVEQSLYSERALQTIKLISLQEAEQAAAHQGDVAWPDAAREITSAKKNSSDADKWLVQLCKYLLVLDNPEEDSRYRRILSAGANGEKPDIPQQLVPIFKRTFQQNKSFLRDSKNN